MASSWVQKLVDMGAFHALHLEDQWPVACFVPRQTGTLTHYYVRGWNTHQGWLPVENHLTPTILPVWAEGVCRFNGSHLARSGVGVMIGEGEGYSVPVTDDHHSSERAELHAAIEALYVIWERLVHLHFQDVIIEMNSAYVVRGITEGVLEWVQNVWKTASGGPVVNADLWKDLLDVVNQMQNVFIGTVYFYRIPRDYNSCAHNLANRAVGIHSG